jgi:hypothetical protein
MMAPTGHPGRSLAVLRVELGCTAVALDVEHALGEGPVAAIRHLHRFRLPPERPSLTSSGRRSLMLIALENELIPSPILPYHERSGGRDRGEEEDSRFGTHRS